MLCSTLIAIKQPRLVVLQRQGSDTPRRLVVARSAKRQTQWDGEGEDYTMKDVERLHEREAARLFHLPADEGQWDGEGRDYDMADVGALAARAVAGKVSAVAEEPTVFNGEGAEYDMLDVERFHDELVAKARRGPDPSQYNGEGPDFSMADVERFCEECAKDKAVRRK